MAEADMQKLQQEALRRVREMQARAQAAAQNGSGREAAPSPRGSSSGGNRNLTGTGGGGSAGNPGRNAHSGGAPGYGGAPGAAGTQNRGSSRQASSSGAVPPGREYIYRNSPEKNSQTRGMGEQPSSPSRNGPRIPQSGRPHSETHSSREQEARGIRGEEANSFPEGQEGSPEAQSGEITDIFQALFQDSDRTIILILLLLVMEEKGDPSLLLALMYLLM